MQTRLLNIPDPVSGGEELREVCEILRRGGTVIIPTETVYGLAADALNPGAVAKIFLAKGRPQDNPLIIHIAGLSQLEGLVSEVPQAALSLAGRFWPGPLTMILPRGELVPDITSAGLPTVAVRMPSHPVARAILKESQIPLAAPSANLSGSPSPTTFRHCVADMMGRVDAIVDGGPCTVGVESTVISLAGPVPRVLRPGGVSVEQLRGALGEVALDPAVLSMADPSQPVSSPGMKYKHYAPKAEVTILKGSPEQFTAFVNSQQQEGLYALCFEGEEQGLSCPAVTYGRAGFPESQAEALFQALRRLDELGAKVAYARAPELDGVGLAVYNRLLRAAAFRVRTLG